MGGLLLVLQPVERDGDGEHKLTERGHAGTFGTGAHPMPVQTQPDDRSTALTRTVGNITRWLGSVPAIIFSFLLVGLCFTGGFFVRDHFSNDTYQLLINTFTTIVTFWMVFII